MVRRASIAWLSGVIVTGFGVIARPRRRVGVRANGQQPHRITACEDAGQALLPIYDEN